MKYACENLAGKAIKEGIFYNQIKTNKLSQSFTDCFRIGSIYSIYKSCIVQFLFCALKKKKDFDKNSKFYLER